MNTIGNAQTHVRADLRAAAELPEQRPMDAESRMADDHFRAFHAVSLAVLLAPLDDAAPSGQDLRSSVLFREIQEARRSEDPRLPLGPWERELKRADWPRVARLCLQALAQRSKDLQLCAWLMEAGTHLHGFAALAPSLVLMRQLCDHYWDDVYPQMVDGEVEYRSNLFRWVDAKLPNTIAILPLNGSNAESPVNLGDWRRANRPDDQGRRDGAAQEAFLSALSTAPTALLRQQLHQLANARAVLQQLDHALDEHCGRDSPGFSRLDGVLDELESLMAVELERRGVLPEREPAATEPAYPLSEPDTASTIGAGSPMLMDADPQTRNSVPVVRQHAYALLADAVDCLMQTDPHSPVPYLIRQAIAWGRLDARELYEELFLKLGGQINVFQLLGLQVPAE